MNRPRPQSENLTEVLFVPFWSSNPYQAKLSDELRPFGFSVSGGTFVIPPSTAGEDPWSIVHLHWIPPVKLAPRDLFRQARYVNRLAKLRRRRIPLIWTAHNLLPHESTHRTLDLRLARWLAARADAIICHSESARREVVAQWRIVQPGKVCVIPHGNYVGVYPNEFDAATCRARLGIPTQSLVFLTLGQIRRYKGVTELVDAFRRLPDPHARLVIAGKPQTAAIDADVRAQIASDRRIIYRPGHVADADLQVYFNASDTVVLPYLKSLTSGALVLAMSFGRACIAPRIESMTECLTSDGGILYDPGVSHGLAQALAEASRRRGELAGIGIRNLSRACEWGWPVVARATAECYERASQACQNR